MCFVISIVLIALGVSFYLEGNTTQSLIYFGVALPFLVIFVRRIKSYIQNKQKNL